MGETTIDETAQSRQLQMEITYETSTRHRRLGETQRVFSRCATGIVSIHTRRNLPEVTERSWACAECNDIDS